MAALYTLAKEYCNRANLELISIATNGNGFYAYNDITGREIFVSFRKVNI